MEYKLFIYIFVLFITFTPHLFIAKTFPYVNIIHALIFTILFYLTYYLVKDRVIEGNEYNLTVDGSNNLKNVIDGIFPNNTSERVKLNVINKHNGLARRKLKEEEIQPYEPAFPYIEKPEPIPRIIKPEETEETTQSEKKFAEPEQPVFTPPDPKEVLCAKPEEVKPEEVKPDEVKPEPITEPPKPIHLYKFNGNGNKTAMDTNNQPHIENKNGSLEGEHIKIEDNALTFGLQSIYSKSYLDLPPNITEGSNIVTIEARVSTLDLNKSWARIFQFGKGDNEDSIFLHRWNGEDPDNGNLAVTIAPPYGNWKFITDTKIKFNNLNQTHIVLVLNGETKDVKLYINRVLVGSMNVEFDLISIINNTRNNYIGRSIDSEDVGFHGKIHEFAIWDVELTPELIENHFKSWTRETGIIPEGTKETFRGQIEGPNDYSLYMFEK